MKDIDQGSSKSRTEQLKHTAKVQARQAGHEIAKATGSALRDIRSEASLEVERQKQGLVAQMDDLRSALGQTAENLDNQKLGGHLNHLASQVDRAADRLKHAEMEEVRSSMEDFAREQTLTFITGSFLAGLLAARFLRSTPPGPQDESPALQAHPQSDAPEEAEQTKGAPHAYVNS